MKIRGTTYAAWGLIIIAIAAWTAAIFFAMAVAGMESDRAASAQATQQTSAAQTSAVRMHALAQDSAPQRAALDALLDVNVVSIVDMINATGKATGVDLKVSGALPETTPGSSLGPATVGAVGFTVEASGTFPALMQAAQLLETLPIPSSVEQLDISQIPNSGGTSSAGKWQMNASIHVLTTSIPSS